jgi:hypothetical protein
MEDLLKDHGQVVEELLSLVGAQALPQSGRRVGLGRGGGIEHREHRASHSSATANRSFTAATVSLGEGAVLRGRVGASVVAARGMRNVMSVR